jgi:precorrin-6A/cobalt-precorrin-6A reductase
MILLLGGTSEAKQVAGWLEKAGRSYIYSTKTDTSFEGRGQYRYGPLDKEALEQFCSGHKISCIINASHPFAAELHKTVASSHLNIPLIRFERQIPERIAHPLLHYMEDYEQALHLIWVRGYTSLLALSGVQSIPRLSPFWRKHCCWFRILDRDSSRALAARHQFPARQLLFGLPQEKREEIHLFRKLGPDVVLTKESGLNGKLDAKIKASVACQIPLIIIEKPALSPVYKLVHTQEELLSLVHQL